MDLDPAWACGYVQAANAFREASAQGICRGLRSLLSPAEEFVSDGPQAGLCNAGDAGIGERLKRGGSCEGQESCAGRGDDVSTRPGRSVQQAIWEEWSMPAEVGRGFCESSGQPLRWLHAKQYEETRSGDVPGTLQGHPMQLTPFSGTGDAQLLRVKVRFSCCQQDTHTCGGSRQHRCQGVCMGKWRTGMRGRGGRRAE